jgi:hypothetical protein
MAAPRRRGAPENHAVPRASRIFPRLFLGGPRLGNVVCADGDEREHVKRKSLADSVERMR